jgi:hypothetical protein
MRRGPSGKQTGYHYLTDNSTSLFFGGETLSDSKIIIGFAERP